MLRARQAGQSRENNSLPRLVRRQDAGETGGPGEAPRGEPPCRNQGKGRFLGAGKRAAVSAEKEARGAACATEGNRRTESQDGGAGLRQAPGGLRPLDAASSGGEMR